MIYLTSAPQFFARRFNNGFVGSEILGGTDQSAISLLAKAHF